MDHEPWTLFPPRELQQWRPLRYGSATHVNRSGGRWPRPVFPSVPVGDSAAPAPSSGSPGCGRRLDPPAYRGRPRVECELCAGSRCV